MTTLAPERCAFCGGSIVTERDEDGLARKCMSCSRETRLIESPRTQTDWQTMAKNRLAEVVRQVAAADPLKREAELIVAALTAAGVQAPELPWKARKSGGGGRSEDRTRSTAPNLPRLRDVRPPVHGRPAVPAAA